MKLLYFIILFTYSYSNLLAKTEIDKAFMKRKDTDFKNFILSSPEIGDKRPINIEQVFDDFDCKGKNISPKLVWRNPPKDTKSFAITIYNKSTKNDSGWWHWVIYDINKDVYLIERGANINKKLLPKKSKQGMNDYGEKKYGGPCPAKGETHNIVITLYALDVEKIDLPNNATSGMISLYLNKHKIKTVKINSYYKREQDKKTLPTRVKKVETIQNTNQKNTIISN